MKMNILIHCVWGRARVSAFLPGSYGMVICWFSDHTSTWWAASSVLPHPNVHMFHTQDLCYLRNGSTGVTWELTQSADSQDPHKTYQIRISILLRIPRITVSTIKSKIYSGYVHSGIIHTNSALRRTLHMVKCSALGILKWALPFHFILSPQIM